MGLVYLSRPYDTQTGLWQGYVYDEHLTYLNLVGDPGPVEITITLVPVGEAPGTGGLRLQKISSPQAYDPMGMDQLHPLLIEFEGPAVSAAELVLAKAGEDGVPMLNGYLAADGSYTASLQSALRMRPQEKGQLLLKGLSPGAYIISEVSTPPDLQGCPRSPSGFGWRKTKCKAWSSLTRRPPIRFCFRKWMAKAAKRWAVPPFRCTA